MREIIKGYECLYKNQIIHRDIKLGNILINNDVAKIADFGLSKIVDGSEEPKNHTTAGTPQYMSP
jgi:polo-like kinase 4